MIVIVMNKVAQDVRFHCGELQSIQYEVERESATGRNQWVLNGNVITNPLDCFTIHPKLEERAHWHDSGQGIKEFAMMLTVNMDRIPVLSGEIRRVTIHNQQNRPAVNVSRQCIHSEYA